jgi:haloacetate dehalogenase
VFEGFDRKRIEADDIVINYVVGGQGPPVLLLHGFPQNHAMWARVAPVLARRFTVVCADLRGYGDSSKPKCLPDNSNYSFRSMAADQVAAMARLGFNEFHVVGHDRGGRTAHRMALDRPDAVRSLAVLDIVPTYAMFMETNRLVAGAYWHWYFLSLPEPFPERLIGNDPDFFYETCLAGWGATRLADFDAEMLVDYRRCWRDPAMIHGSCSDYRAAATIDIEHDRADLGRRVTCPTLALWGAKGLMHQHFDLAAQWAKRCANLRTATLPGGHFFVDQFPGESAQIIAEFIAANEAGR